MDTKQNYLIKNTIIFTISSFATKILSFFLVPIYTSILTTSEYGYADLIITTTTVLVYIFTLNIADSVVRFTIIKDNNPLSVLGFSLKVIIIGSCICGILIGAIDYFNVISWPNYCNLFLFLIFCGTSINSVLLSYARGVDEIKKVGVAGVLSSAITIIANIVFLVILDLRLKGYMLATFLGIVMSILYLILSLKISLYKVIHDEDCSGIVKENMIRYSTPLIFNGIAWWLNSAFDRYSITYLQGVNQNGLYSVASKIPLILATINGIFGQAWGLSAIKDIDDNDKDGFFSNTYSNYNFILVCIGSVLIWFNIPLSRVLFAKEFFQAWHFSSILIVSSIFNALASFLGGAFTRTMKTDMYAKTSVLSTTLNIGMNLVLINLIGTIGAAIATASSFIVLWLIRYIMAGRYISLKVEIGKQIISYIILLVQVIIEQYLSRYSNIHLLCLMLLFIIYREEMINLFKCVTHFLARKDI